MYMYACIFDWNHTRQPFFTIYDLWHTLLPIEWFMTYLIYLSILEVLFDELQGWETFPTDNTKMKL